MFTWIKSVGWIKTAVAIVGAVGLVLAARKVRRWERRSEAADRRSEELLALDEEKHFNMAVKFSEKAARYKQRAADANTTMHENLEKLGENDATLDELAHHFNSKRVSLREDIAARLESSGSNPF